MDKVIVHYNTSLQRNITFEVDPSMTISDLIHVYLELTYRANEDIGKYRFAISGVPIIGDEMREELGVFASDFGGHVFIYDCCKGDAV